MRGRRGVFTSCHSSPSVLTRGVCQGLHDVGGEEADEEMVGPVGGRVDAPFKRFGHHSAHARWRHVGTCRGLEVHGKGTSPRSSRSVGRKDLRKQERGAEEEVRRCKGSHESFCWGGRWSRCRAAPPRNQRNLGRPVIHPLQWKRGRPCTNVDRARWGHLLAAASTRLWNPWRSKTKRRRKEKGERRRKRPGQQKNHLLWL